MIVVCPNCGTKNHLPDLAEPGQKVRCAKCQTSLTDVVAARNVQREGDTACQGRSRQTESTDSLEPARIGELALPASRLAAVRGWFGVRENQLVLFLVLLALILHLCIVPFGDIPIFDEHYYIPEAQSIVHGGNLTVIEHPPLGKLFIALGILALGDNPWGWRIPSVVFALACVVLFYLVCRELAGKLTAFFASLLLLFETLTFLYSGLATLDVFSLAFMLLSFLFYLRGRYALSGAALALSGLCKVTGLFGGAVIVVHWLIRRRREPAQGILVFVVAALGAFLVLMPLFDFAATREWLNPIGRIYDMVVAHRALTFGAITPGALAGEAPPWNWIVNPLGYQFLYIPAYRAWITFTVWVLIIPSQAYMVYEFARRKTDVSLFSLLWFAATYLVWIPIVLATDRQTFLYYFYPTVGTICLAIGFCLAKLWGMSSEGRRTQWRGWIRLGVAGYLGAHVLLFLLVSPLVPALAFISSSLAPQS